jgi:hypothetical protein
MNDELVRMRKEAITFLFDGLRKIIYSLILGVPVEIRTGTLRKYKQKIVIPEKIINVLCRPVARQHSRNKQTEVAWQTNEFQRQQSDTTTTETTADMDATLAQGRGTGALCDQSGCYVRSMTARAQVPSLVVSLKELDAR